MLPLEVIQNLTSAMNEKQVFSSITRTGSSIKLDMNVSIGGPTSRVQTKAVRD